MLNGHIRKRLSKLAQQTELQVAVILARLEHIKHSDHWGT